MHKYIELETETLYLVQQLLDENKFSNYFPMFDELFDKIKLGFKCHDTNMRHYTPGKERLTVTIRYAN